MTNRIAAHHRFLYFNKVLAYKETILKVFAEPLVQFRAFGAEYLRAVPKS